MTELFSRINKGIMMINGVFIAVYLLFFQQIPLIGRPFRAIAANLEGDSLERILIYGIGILTVASLLLFTLVMKGRLLQLTMLLFSIYVAHIFIGKISVAFFNKFFKPWGIPDPWATILLFVTAVLFTVTMLIREANNRQEDAANAA